MVPLPKICIMAIAMSYNLPKDCVVTNGSSEESALSLPFASKGISEIFSSPMLASLGLKLTLQTHQGLGLHSLRLQPASTQGRNSRLTKRVLHTKPSLMGMAGLESFGLENRRSAGTACQQKGHKCGKPVRTVTPSKLVTLPSSPQRKTSSKALECHYGSPQVNLNQLRSQQWS